jgi:tetrahydromethanopterin S-methyltransferase subunit A
MNTISIDVDLTPYLPEKEDAYVSYNSDSRDFYVSTVDDDQYAGRITMEAIVDLYIEGYEMGEGGNISSEDAAPFIEDLEKAIARVKARIST